MHAEGSRVLYVGDDGAVPVGSAGLVLTSSGNSNHVRWANGSFGLHADSELTAALGATTAARSELDDSLEVGGLHVMGVRAVMESGGPAALLNQLAESGGLGSFTAIAEEAYGVIRSRVRQDPVLRSVASQLDEEDAESLYSLASTVLLRDAFGVEPE